MCGRYQIHSEAMEKASKELSLKYLDFFNGNIDSFAEYCESSQTFSQEGQKDVFPGNTAFILIGKDNEVVAVSSVWGFDNKSGSLLINARSETIESKPIFASSFTSRRCLVPASAFYEWDKEKNKVTFSISSKAVIYLAGIWTMINDELRFTIITKEASNEMRPVHDRMPVIIDSDDARKWIFDIDAARELMKKSSPTLTLVRDEEQLSLL